VSRAFTVTGARVAHDAAPVAVLEAATRDDVEARLHELAARDGVAEAFCLQTCNRVEEYVVTEVASAGESALADFGAGVDPSHVVRTDHETSLRHLLRVAAGLESQVLGEDQVLGQLRDAYLTAERVGVLGPVLEAALLKAIHVGERARTETAINDGTVSLGSAAVQLADRERGLADRRVLLVGAGEMATIVANGLAYRNVAELTVVNRTPARAAALADSLAIPARADGLESLATHLAAADVVITATGSHEPVIERGHVANAGPTLLVDLAQPRDVADGVDDVPGIEVFDLDALEAVTTATHEERRAAAAAVEDIVEAEFEQLMDGYKRRRADAVIRGMYRGAERIKRRELQTALSKLDRGDGLSGAQRAVVEGLADALVNQLLAVPTESLRDAAAEDDWETVASAIRLFDPSLLTGAVPAELRALAAFDEATDEPGAASVDVTSDGDD